MATKFDLMALKAKHQGVVKSLNEKARAGIDAAEIGAGAAVAGYLDVAVPTIAGIPTSAAVGIAAFVAGAVSEQRDITQLGVGLLAGAAYKQGAALAMNQGTVSNDASARKAV